MSDVTRESLIQEAREAKEIALSQGNRSAVLNATKLLRSLGDDTWTDQEEREVALVAAKDAVPTALYRHFNKAGELLYVGISVNAAARTSAHEFNAPWFQEVTRIDIEWFGSRSAASHAEEHAIKTERPKCNITHNRTTNGRADKPATRTILSVG